jgi:stage II sporulation protein E
MLNDIHEPSVLVWRNSRGRLSIDIEAKNLSPLHERIGTFPAELEKVLGKKMGEPEFTSDISGDRIKVRECEPYSVRIGVAAHKRKNSSMSGDCGTYFKTEDGVIYVILSDGMGSGKEAAVESASVVRLLEKFIRAGIDAESALRTVNSALMLRNIDEGGFATLDMLAIDLFTGEGKFFKCGASPSYIRAGKKVRNVSGKVFPPGTGILPAAADISTLSLEGNEVLTMLSDGAYNPDNDALLRQEMLEYKAGSPKDLALKIAGAAAEKNKESDDATVVVVEIALTR